MTEAILKANIPLLKLRHPAAMELFLSVNGFPVETVGIFYMLQDCMQGNF